MTDLEKLLIAENETVTHIQKLMSELSMTELEMVIVLECAQNRIKGMALARNAYNSIKKVNKDDKSESETQTETNNTKD